MKYNVSVYPESFKGKDKSYMNASAKKITKLIPKYCQNLSVDELAAAIENMHVFCPATFIGNHKSQDELASIQFFALDFDGGIDIDTAINRAEEYKLPIAIRYETSSSRNWSKFRLIFLCCQEVRDKDLAVLIQYCLCTIFPEVDKTSKDFSKLYYPGKNIICNDVSFSIFDLIISVIMYTSKNDPGNKVRVLNQIAKKSNVVLLNNTFAFIPNSVSLSSGALFFSPPAEEAESILETIAQSEEFRAVTIYNNMVDVTESSKIGSLFFSETYQEYSRVYKETERKRNIELVRTNISGDTYCRLLNDFKSGIRLAHDEWFGLSLNLIHIKGGRTLINNTLLRCNSIYNDIERKKAQIEFACRNGYRAQRCADYCPYANECEHESNMVYTLKVASKKIVKLRTEPIYKDIEEMRQELRCELEAVISQPGIKIIQAPTGAGKTYAELEVVKNSDRQTIIAVPNKMLMNAVAIEAEKKGVSYFITPVIDDLIDRLNSDTAKLIRHMYAVGNDRNINYVLRSCDEQSAHDYLTAMESLRKFKGQLIITTHARLLKMKPDYLNSRNVIIDEDILPSMMQIKQIRISDIRDILDGNRNEEPLPTEAAEKLQRIKNVKGYEIIEAIDTDIFDNDDILKINRRISCDNSSAIYQALRARCFYHDGDSDEINFIESLPLPKSDCVILSATVNETLYRRILGDSLSSFKDLGCLKYRGQLYLHHDRSYSKSCITENTELITNLREVHGNRSNIITFKDFAHYGELYFGAAQGSNEFAGQDLAVIGTFHRPEYVYKLWAMRMGDLNTDDTLAVRRIERNGFNFPFMTFSNDLLREIQLYMIESEAEQAVGRARLVSHNCIVNLYSNLPLKQCTLK